MPPPPEVNSNSVEMLRHLERIVTSWYYLASTSTQSTPAFLGHEFSTVKAIFQCLRTDLKQRQNSLAVLSDLLAEKFPTSNRRYAVWDSDGLMRRYVQGGALQRFLKLFSSQTVQGLRIVESVDVQCRDLPATVWMKERDDATARKDKQK